MANTESVEKDPLLLQDGQEKTVLNDSISKSGYMTIEEAKQLTIEKIKKIINITMHYKFVFMRLFKLITISLNNLIT